MKIIIRPGTTARRIEDSTLYGETTFTNQFKASVRKKGDFAVFNRGCETFRIPWVLAEIEETPKAS